MIVKGINSTQAKIAISAVAQKYHGNIITRDGVKSLNQKDTRVSFSLRTVSSSGPGTRTSASGRRMPVACWHVFRDVCREIFAFEPHAEISTGLRFGSKKTVYRGSDHFEATYPATRRTNIGSLAAPVWITEVCECVGL